MKKKAVVAMLVMCMALSAAACGKKKAAESTETAKEDASPAKEDKKEDKKEEKKEDKEAPKSSKRIVSVDDVSKYVTVGEYKGIALDKVAMPVSDVEIESEIEYRLEGMAEEVPDGAAEMGDQVRINFDGTIDGETFEGGSQKDYDIVVGGSGIAEEFDNGLVGMKKGETKEITVNFPEDYYDVVCADKTVVYQVTMQKISRAPQLTDEWVAANTENKTVDEYKAAIGKELEDNADEMAMIQLYSDAWYTVLEGCEVKEYPKEDVEKAAAAYEELYAKSIEAAGMDMSEFLESQGISQEDFDAECNSYAEAKVKQNLIVQYILDQEGLSFEGEEAKEFESQLLQMYGAENLEQLAELYGQVEVDESLALLTVQKFITDNAEINEMVGGGDEVAENEDAFRDEEVYETTDAEADEPAAEGAEEAVDPEEAETVDADAVEGSEELVEAE